MRSSRFGSRGRTCKQLVHLLLVLDDGEADLGVFEDEQHLVGDRVLVDGDGDARRASAPRPWRDRGRAGCRRRSPPCRRARGRARRGRRRAPASRRAPGATSTTARCRGPSRAGTPAPRSPRRGQGDASAACRPPPPRPVPPVDPSLRAAFPRRRHDDAKAADYSRNRPRNKPRPHRGPGPARRSPRGSGA